MSAKKKSNLLKDINELLLRADSLINVGKQQLKAEQKKKRVCKTCGATQIFFQGNCRECHETLRTKVNKDKEGKVWISSNGYPYTYNSQGKPVLYHRHRMAELLGRPLTTYEVVTFKDGDRSNVSDENLVLGIRNGDLTRVICPHCETPYLQPRQVI